MSRYVVAIKREQRSAAPSDWLERLERIEGLEVQGRHNPYRVQITASDEAIRTARHRMGDLLHIEPLIIHEPQSIR
jgi:hypothetical protein